MTNSLKTIVLFTAACLLSNQSLNADSIFGNFLTYDGPQHTPGGIPFQGGGEDKLQDDSLSRFFDYDMSGSFSNGDQIVSMVTLSEFRASGRNSVPVGENSQIALISSFEIQGMGAGGSFNLVPVVGGANGLSNLLNGSISGPAGLNANSYGVVVSTSTSTENPANDPLNWMFSDINSLFSVGNNWNWEATYGPMGWIAASQNQRVDCLKSLRFWPQLLDD